MSQSLQKQLIEHLKQEAPQGVPAAWLQASRGGIEGAGEEPNIRGEPVGSAKRKIADEGESGSRVDPSPSEFAALPLEELREIALSCTRCRLCEGRTKVVFGVGNINRPLVAFVGEGPGAEEDKTGEPFVGRAGQLLTAAITKGMGLRREDVYIANVVKCRPPENRAPLPDETAACTPYLFRQLEIIQPRVIITLGQPAQMALSSVQQGITKLRGNWQTWRGIKLMPTFHPAYLLRNPPAKKFFWEDLKTVMAELGLEVPSSGAGE